MKVLEIDGVQYNLAEARKLSKSVFEKCYSKKNPQWESHWEQIQATKVKKAKPESGE